MFHMSFFKYSSHICPFVLIIFITKNILSLEKTALRSHDERSHRTRMSLSINLIQPYENRMSAV